jgi:hypothetical protein
VISLVPAPKSTVGVYVSATVLLEAEVRNAIVDGTVGGYPEGAILKRDEGSFRSLGPRHDFYIKSVAAVEGQSGSPLFDRSTLQVVGVILNRQLTGADQEACETESVKLSLRHEPLFRGAFKINRLMAEAVGPLTTSDAGPSLKNAFDNVESPTRWHKRAELYQRTDAETPWLGDPEGWLGLQRTYLSSRHEENNVMGRGWVHAYQYKVDMKNSDLCAIQVIKSQGARETFHSIQDCDNAKSDLAAQVTNASELPGSLSSLLGDDHLASEVLPSEQAPTYVGADLAVSRAHFVPRGIEIFVGSSKYTFNVLGRLSHVRTERFDVELNYDINGRLTLASDSKRAMQLDYDHDHLVKLSFSDGSIYDYTYSSGGDLLQVSINGEVTRRYEYDSLHRLAHVWSAKDPEIERKISYDSAGRRQSVITPDREYRWEFSDREGKSAVKQSVLSGGSVDQITDYLFDDSDKSLEMVSPGKLKIYHLTTCLCLPLDVETFRMSRRESTGIEERVSPGEKVRYKYDVFGRLTLVDDVGKLTSIEYDERASKISKISASDDGKAWRVKAQFFFNDQRLLRRIDADRTHILLEYDADGKISVMKTSDDVLHFVYNLAKKPIQVTRGDGSSVKFTYTSTGEVDRIVSAGGSEVATAVMRSFQSLIDASSWVNSARTDNGYSNIDFVQGDRKCACSLE